MDSSAVMFLSDSHSDGTHSLQSIHWLSFWRHPFTAEHPLALIMTAPIHCRASIDSHYDGTHSLQSIHWLSFWWHPFTDADTFLQIWRNPEVKYEQCGWPKSVKTPKVTHQIFSFIRVHHFTFSLFTALHPSLCPCITRLCPVNAPRPSRSLCADCS